MEELDDFIIAWVQDRSGILVKLNDDLFDDGGIDSLLFAELLAVLEDQFSIVISFNSIEDWTKIRSPRGLAELCTDCKND